MAEPAIVSWVEPYNMVYTEGGGAGDVGFLPAADLLAMWYAGNGSEVHSSITGSDGNPVSAWADSGVNGYDVSQGVAANQPTYHQSLAAMNNRGAVEFDGDDYLARSLAGIIANLDVYTILQVWITDNADLTAGLYGEVNTGTATPFITSFGAFTGRKAAFRHRDDSSVQTAMASAGGVVLPGVMYLGVVRRIASNNWSLRVDGTEVATSTAAPTTTTIDTTLIGARGGPDAFLTGKLALLALYGADNYTTIEPPAADHYGKTLP